VIEVSFNDAATVATARAKLAAVGSVSVAGRVLHVGVTDGPRAMLETVRTLDAAGLAPATLMLREPTLDDVFLTLTGHVAEETSEASDGALTAAPRRDGRGGA
jgi:ABC-2 type transport system ATP-binding protein